MGAGHAYPSRAAGPTRQADRSRAAGPAAHADRSRPPEPSGLWEAARAGDDDARERLILQYAPLVKYMAGRVGSGLPASVDGGDLVGYGMVGLLDAVARYEPAHGPFEPFALPRIRGAILDELRSLDWVPRSVRAKSRELERATAAALSRGGGTANEADIAAEMGVAVPTLRHILTEVSYRHQVALDAPVAGSPDDVDAGSHLADLLADPGATDPAGAAADADTRRRLWRAVSKLTERERDVIALFYREGLTLTGVAEALGITVGRASQLHTKAVATLRVRLSGLAEAA